MYAKSRRLAASVLLVGLLVLVANLHTIALDKPPKKLDKTYEGGYPQVSLPLALRQKNWLGPKGEGSCVHASLVSIFRVQGRFKLADWWKQHNGDGSWPADLAAKLEKAGVKYAFTSNKGDVKFLEWACKTHRGCCVTVRGATHMVALVHLDKKWAGILDNNETQHIIWVPRKTFIAEWMNSESWAVALVYTPSPPKPVVIQ